MPQVKLLLTIGWLDQDSHNLPPGKAGDTINVDDRQRSVLVKLLRCAEDVTPPLPQEPEEVIQTAPKPAAVQARPAEPKSTKNKEK